ncbi:hypothetical protein L873DRAFT_1765207 [Choiromyces venosus 120613-1]|uniref:mRNA export factor MEX67 n=1 Tax=Choiromyces venosus 120613-1 TaxID=1336337 RepID=A0A3N4JR95_9PEZI|nr:hypothetical protein L873DRAFT_1765207 [Choiromyces venosus 120613-1]
MNSTALRPQGSHGGIAKRTGGRTRVDRDGDLDMVGPSGGRGGRGRGSRIRGSRGGAASRGGRSGAGSIIPTGPAANRTDSGQNRGIPARGPRNGAVSVSETLVEVRITGWKESKGSAEEAIAFLERKSRIKLRKTLRQGDTIIAQVAFPKIHSILEWNDAQFASSKLKLAAPSLGRLDVTERSEAVISRANPANKATVDTIQTLEGVLANRYNPESKFLDLSRLGEDVLLKANGFFQLNSTTSKMFPALMQVAEKKFTTAQQKRDTVHSVSLGYNNLKDVRAVSSLSVTFPDLKNLSLEGNSVGDWKALDNWRHRFKNLEQLVLLGNPITSQPGYVEEAYRRYPKLLMLDNVPADPLIRAKIQAETSANNASKPVPTGADGRPILPHKVQPSFIQDDYSVGMKFLSRFFETYDANRTALLHDFYDAESLFSLSVNTSAPRTKEQQNTRQFWDEYIPKSRNLKRVSLRGRVERLAMGPDEISKLWAQLPATKHDLANGDAWSFDIWPVEVTTGVMGMLCTVHAEFQELNEVDGPQKIVRRSFDRSFTLRPDVLGEVKVANDMLVVRAYGGFDSWKPEAPAAAAPASGTAKTGEAGKKEMCERLINQTGLKMEWANMCLEETGWNLENAWKAFLEAKANGAIPPDAYTTTTTNVPTIGTAGTGDGIL